MLACKYLPHLRAHDIEVWSAHVSAAITLSPTLQGKSLRKDEWHFSSVWANTSHPRENLKTSGSSSFLPSKVNISIYLSPFSILQVEVSARPSPNHQNLVKISATGP